MSSKNDSIIKTLVVATVLCLVCSVIVSTAAIGLKPLQQANKSLDKKRNILVAAGVYDALSVGKLSAKEVEASFQQIEPRIVNLQTGEFVSDIDAASYDQRKAAKDPAQNVVLDGAIDIAKIKRRAQNALVYLVKDDKGKVKSLILPMHGYGLWSTMYGFLALEADTKTVVGLKFYQQAETPGLGGEVDNPAWLALWKGKQVFDEQWQVDIAVAKGGVDPHSAKAAHRVDGLSGATLTSNGVSNLLQYWLSDDAFGVFLKRFRQQGGQG